MARAPIVAAGGVMVLENLMGDAWFRALRQEGLAARQRAREQLKLEADDGGWRGGNPRRHLATAEGGPVLDAIYADSWIRAFLGSLVGHDVRQTGAHGSYSFYDRPGYFLGLHRDITRCDLTLITCLHRVDGSEPSGALRLYPKAVGAPLKEVAPETPCLDIETRAGQSVLLLGGCVPHEVLPTADGFARAISVLCFEILPNVPDRLERAAPG